MNYSKNPPELWEPISRLVLEAAYEGTLYAVRQPLLASEFFYFCVRVLLLCPGVTFLSGCYFYVRGGEVGIACVRHNTHPVVIISTKSCILINVQPGRLRSHTAISSHPGMRAGSPRMGRTYWC